MNTSSFICCKNSKDVIIEVLQNQVKNFQELYKQTEEEKDGLRNRIIDTQREIGRLKKLLDKRRTHYCHNDVCSTKNKEDKPKPQLKEPVEEEEFSKKIVNPVSLGQANKKSGNDTNLVAINVTVSEPQDTGIKIESRKVESNHSLRPGSWIVIEDPNKVEVDEKEMQVTFLSTPRPSKTSVTVLQELVIGPEPRKLSKVEISEKPIQTEIMQLNEVEKHVQILTDDIRRLNKQIQVKNNLINMLEKKVATTQMSLNLENTKLEEKLARLKMEVNEYVSKEEKWKEDKSKLIELIKNLQEQLTEYQVISKELMALKNDNTVLNNEKNQLVNDIGSLVQDIKQLKSDHLSTVEELKKVFELKLQEKTAELEKACTQNWDYFNKIKEINEMNEDLLSQLKQKEATIDELKSTQEQQINELNGLLQRSEKKIEAYEEALDKVEKERLKLEEQVKGLELDKNEVVKQMEEKNKEFEEKLVNLENDYRNLNDLQKKEYEEKITDLQNVVNVLKGNLSEEQKILDTAMKDLSKLLSENINLKKQNEELNQQLESAQQIVLEHDKDKQLLIDSLKDENAKYKKDNELLQEQLIQKEELINELQAINKEVQDRQTNQFSEIFIEELAKVQNGNVQLIENFSILLGKIDRMHSQGDSHKDVLSEIDKVQQQIVALTGKVDSHDLNNLILKLMDRLSLIEQGIPKQTHCEPNSKPVNENRQLNKDIHALEQQINSLCVEKETIISKMRELQMCTEMSKEEVECHCQQMAKIMNVIETENQELTESNSSLKSEIEKLRRQLNVLQESNSKLQAENETVRKIIGSATSLKDLPNTSIECLQKYVNGELIKKDSLIRNLEMSLQSYKEIVQECETELRNLKKKNDLLNDLYNEIKNKYQSVASNT